jgi:hypothetical protein
MKTNLKWRTWQVCASAIMVFMLPSLGLCGEHEAKSPLGPCTGPTAHAILSGIPYSSKTTDGRFVSGAIRIDHFFAVGHKLKADGLFFCGGHRIENVFPVEVDESSCAILELKVGPPTVRGVKLVDPLLLVQQVGQGFLQGFELCDIAGAVQAGRTAQLASLLNETSLEQTLIDNGFLAKACHWTEAIACSPACVACRGPCGPGNPRELCLSCMIAAGTPFCLDCCKL